MNQAFNETEATVGAPPAGDDAAEAQFPPLSGLEKARLAARAADETKAEDVVVLDVRRICNFTDYFVIATGASSPQLRGATNRIARDLRDRGCRATGSPGPLSPNWSILDFGDVVVHVFSPESRQYYRLETLWNDAARVPWQA